MANIVRFLNNRKLIKKYPKRSEHSELDIPSSKDATTLRHGLLDPPPPEEQERLKREFIASQPLKELFSKEELEKIFAEPDYTQIIDLLKRAQAYDWSGKYTEALNTLKKAKGIEAKFELARFLKYGRPEIPADNKKSNQLFSEVVLFVETKSSIHSSEEYCLAGRACREFQPANWDETMRWKKKADDFFQKAIAQRYLPAYYYSQYYERHSSNNEPDDLLKSLSSDNLDAKVFIAGLAATNQYFKKYRNRKENLKVIKEAVLAHNNLAQCVLGMLYLVADTDPNAFLRHDRRKAKFWLQRAADRGDQDAKEILKNDSRFKFSKKE